MKLIDVLIMISKGELKEGTKVKLLYDDTIYELYCDDLIREGDNRPFFDLYTFEVFREEVELIEPECKHEWSNYSIGRLGGITEHYRSCDKCGIREEIQPNHIDESDKKVEKIEELDVDSCGVINEYNSQGEVYARGFNMGVFKKEIVDKLNEVIRRLNNAKQ